MLSRMYSVHGSLQAYFTEFFCHDIGISEFIGFFMLNSIVSVQIKSLIESVSKNIEIIQTTSRISNLLSTIRVSSYLTYDPGGRLQNERIHRFVSLTERATYTFLPGLPRYERQSRCVYYIFIYFFPNFNAKYFYRSTEFFD